MLAVVLASVQLLHADISLSPNTANAAAGGAINSVQIIATSQSITWTASSNQTWLTFTSATSGTGTGSVNYAVAGNPFATSRTAIITVTPTPATPTTLVVTQLGGILSVSPSSANIGQNGDSGVVAVYTEDPSLQWTAVSSDAWLSITSGATGIGPGNVNWTGAANSTNHTRTATITITPLSGVGQTFTVSQQASNDPRITFSPSSANVDAAGGTGTVSVSATDPTLTWTVTSDSSWLTIASGSGTGSGNFTYTAAPNPNATTRSATITGNPSRGPNVTMTVTQSGGVLVVSPSSANVPAAGGTGSVTLTTTASALQWTVTSNQSWLTITSGSSGHGSGTVQWSAAANSSGDPRSGILTITPSSGSAQIFSVNQAGAITGTLSLNPASASVPPSVSVGTVQVTSTNQALTWLASSDQSWLTINSGSSGTGNGAIQYTATGNTTAAQRIATITVTPQTGTPVTFVVTQAATSASITPTSAPALANGGTGSFAFSTNNATLQWTASSSDAWLTLTSPLSGTADATMNWAAAANTSTAARTATITITPAAGPVLTFTVKQLGGTGSINVTPSPISFSYQQLSTPPTDVQLAVSSSGVALSYTAAATTTSGGTWLSVTGASGTTPGAINVSANPSGLAAGTYQGSITVTAAGATPVTVPVTLTVTPALVLSALPNSLTFAFQQNGPQPSARTVQLRTSGTPQDSLDYSIVNDPNATWLTASGAGPAPATLTVSVNPTGLQPGTYPGTITLISPAAGNSPLTIPVTLTVSAAPTMIPSPQSLAVTYRQLDPLPGPVTVGVTSSGDNFGYTADVASGAWLSVLAIVPRTTGQTPSTIQIGINPTGLSPGTYQGSIVLMSPTAGNSALTVPVTLTVLPAATLSVQPQQLSFSLTQNVDTGATTTVGVSSSSPASFTVSSATASGGNWLSVLSSGAQTPASLNVSVASAGLAPGAYQGAITLTSAQASNSPLVIPVTLTISAQPRLVVFPTQLIYVYQLSSGPFPSKQFILVNTSDHTQASVTASVTTTSGGNWLSAGHGVTTPQVLEVTADPSGLTADNYAGIVTLNSPGYAPVTIPVTFRILNAPALNVSPTVLSFSYQQGASVPQAQSVALSTTLTPLLFNAVPAPGAPWLTVTGGGLTPSSVSVSVNPQGLAPGTYNGSAMITALGAGNSPLLVPVQLTVTSAPVLSVQPGSLSFTFQPGGSLPGAQSLHLSGGDNLSFSTSIQPQEAWLQVSGDSTTPGTLNVSVDPSGLTAGQYTASLLVTAPGAANSPVVVPITLTIVPARLLTPSPSQFTFSYQLLGPQPSNQVLTISDPTLVATATASTVSGGNWLSVAGGGSGGAIFSLSVNPANLTAGTYQGSVALAAANAGNSPVNIPVTLVVSGAPVMTAAPGQLAFSYQIGNPPPAGASFQLSSSGIPLAFHVAASTVSGGSWLAVSSGSTTPGTVTAGIDPTGLVPGTYAGTISVTSAGAGNSPLLVPVTLSVTTSTNLTAAPTSLNFAAQEHGASPAVQTVHLSTGGPQFGVTYMVSPSATWLTFNGTPTAPGDVTVTVTSGALAAGTYTAVIQVQSDFAANSPLSIPVTLVVSATPVLSAFPATLQYNYDLLGPKPPLQSFSVNALGGTVDYTVSVVPGSTWLFASGNGTTSGSVSATVDPGVLSPGQYQGAILITPSNNSAPIQVPVVLNVSGAPMLSSQPTSLAFAYQVNGPLPQARTLVVSSDRGSQSISVGTQVFTGGNWLVTGGGGTTPAVVTASVNPAGLAPGVYEEQITIASTGAGNSPLLIPVTLTVSAAPTIIASPPALSFAAQVGGSPINQQITLTSSDGTALPIGSVVLSGGSGAGAVSVNSNTTPATVTVTVTPGSLSAGVYQASIVVSSPTAGNGPLTIPLTLTLSPQPSLIVSPPSAVFAYTVGTPAPPPVSLLVASTSTSIPFTAVVVQGSPWLSVVGGGATPASLQIAVDPSTLSPGAYHGTILVSSSAAANGVVTVPVDLIVTSGPVLTAGAPYLTFTTLPSGSPPPQTLQITSTGAGLSFTTTTSPGTPWLTVTGSGGTPQTVTVSISSAGLSPGVYQGTVQITAAGAANSPLTVPVILIINAVAALQATPSPVSFNYQPGGNTPAPQTVGLTLGGQPATVAQSTVAPGTPWLSVANAAGGNINIVANPAGLLPGRYNGTVVVVNNSAANNPLSIPVTLTVGGPPVFDISQDALAFTAVTAQSQPISTTITVGTGNNPPVSFSSNVTASTWLSVSPLTGTTPTNVTVTVDPTGLRPGSYSGSVIVSSSGNVIRTIPVNLAVADAPNLNVSPPFLEFSYSHGSSQPSPVNVFIARFGADISVTATPNVPWITVDPSTPSTSGPITVTVSATGLAAGVYHGIVTFALANPPAGTLPVPSKQLPVTLYVDQPADPRIYSVVSGMSFLDTPLTPGLIFTILGTNLGPVTPVGMEIQPDQTVSQILGGVQVLVNGIPCPLLYVSSVQINAIAPYALFNKTSANVSVRYLGLLSDAVPVSVSVSAPGLFSFPPTGAGPGAILNQDQSVNTATNRAAADTIISLFAGGGGQTTPQGIDGLVTPTTVLPQLIQPVSVTIGGVPATDITYVGAAPGLVSGALQVNVRIPASVPSGDQPVVLRIGNAISQSGLVVSVR